METVYNLFVFVSLDFINEVGVAIHTLDGTDHEKITFLQKQVNEDLNSVIKYDLPESFQTKVNGIIRMGIDLSSYRELCHQGNGLLIFQRAFIPPEALVVITMVKNGEILIEGVEPIKNTGKTAPKSVYIEKQKEWFEGYIDSDGFHFDRLINDDFIEAARLLYNANHYVSSMKLLMICIDTIAYLEFGDIPRNFQEWLDQYAELSLLNISSDELKEFRNSLLHMTNLDSRKVQSKKVKRLMFYISHPDTDYVQESDEGKYFRFKDFIDCLMIGIGKWAESYNSKQDKFETFLFRYDRIVSDKRMTHIKYHFK